MRREDILSEDLVDGHPLANKVSHPLAAGLVTLTMRGMGPRGGVVMKMPALQLTRCDVVMVDEFPEPRVPLIGLYPPVRQDLYIVLVGKMEPVGDLGEKYSLEDKVPEPMQVMESAARRLRQLAGDGDVSNEDTALIRHLETLAAASPTT